MKKTYYMATGRKPRGTTTADTHSVTEGVAATGEESKLGTVEHIYRRDGSNDAVIRPRPVKVVMRTEQ